MTTLDPFADVPAPLRQAMERRGFSEPTPVQLAVLAEASSGRDLRISSQTGSGKTVALGFALAEELLAATGTRPSPKAPLTLVITPTRELAMQVGDELRWLYADVTPLRVVVVTGGTDPVRERRELARGAEIVVGTPGRLLDHVRGGALQLDVIRDVVLDEADRMLELGFREELDAILEQLPAERRSHLVSATFPSQVRRLADRFQNEPQRIEGNPAGGAHEDIEHVVHLIAPGDTYAAIVNVLLAAMGGRCLIFVERRADASALAEKLASEGFAALPLSGELPQAQRTRTLEAFRNGSVPILVATDVAGRGIDVPDIAAVIHADPPKNPDAYTHRSGRTGRAGRKGRSVLLVPVHARQRARRLLDAARVEARWIATPTAEKIQKALGKQARRRLHERLATGEAASERHRAHAEALLEEQDPAQLVAMLLELAEPIPCREPATLVEPRKPEPAWKTAPRGRSEHRRDAGPGRQAAGRRPPGAAGASPGDRSAPPRRPAPQVALGPSPRFIRFFLSWGEQRGATTQRVLAHVCRRGGIKGKQVGAIRVGAFSTTFEIDREAANEFETRASRRDPREPRLRIARHRDDTSSERQQASA